MNYFTANQITVFKKKGISMHIKMIRGNEWVTITCGLMIINAVSTSQIIS